MSHAAKVTLLAIATIVIAAIVWAGLSLAVGADYTNGAFYYGTELTANVVFFGALALAAIAMIAGLVKIELDAYRTI